METLREHPGKAGGTRRVKQLAASVGFDLAGVASPGPTIESLFYPRWLEEGHAGGMQYLYGRRARLREDARRLFPAAKSVICVAVNYHAGRPLSSEARSPRRGWIARYAWGDDYHHILKQMLLRLAGEVEAEFGPHQYKVAVDTSPLLERAYAQQAGLGWIGNNTCVINEQAGSWLLLGELLTSHEFEPDSPAPFRCGTCTRCIEACPTDALVPVTQLADGASTPQPGYALDSRRCISYWTIELRDGIPEENRAEVGQHVFGCDICQDVCPWNRRAPLTQVEELKPRNDWPDLAELAAMDEGEFHRRFAGTPIERSRYRGFLRNVAVVMGNSGNPEFLELLERIAGYPDEVVREHAAWAINRLRSQRTERNENTSPSAAGGPHIE